MVASRETAELAKRLIADTCDKQNIQPGQLSDLGYSQRLCGGTSPIFTPETGARAKMREKQEWTLMRGHIRRPRCSNVNLTLCEQYCPNYQRGTGDEEAQHCIRRIVISAGYRAECDACGNHQKHQVTP